MLILMRFDLEIWDFPPKREPVSHVSQSLIFNRYIGLNQKILGGCLLSTQAGNLVKSVDSLHFINGEYVPSLSGKVKENINPATEEVISIISQGGKEEVDTAVALLKKR